MSCYVKKLFVGPSFCGVKMFELVPIRKKEIREFMGTWCVGGVPREIRNLTQHWMHLQLVGFTFAD